MNRRPWNASSNGLILYRRISLSSSRTFLLPDIILMPHRRRARSLLKQIWEITVNALHYGDQSLGTLLRGLRERKLEQNTLFVLYGDHGEAFGQHEGNRGHSMFIYDENVRVPLMIAAPGLIQGEVRALQTASLIDVEPTILDLLGHPIPSQLQGSSLLDSPNNMALFFTDYSLGLSRALRCVLEVHP